MIMSIDRKFYVASPDEVISGNVTDIYYLRAMDVLLKKGLISTKVVMDVHAYSFPSNYDWAVLAGLEEVLHLFIGKKNVNVYAMDEGTIFRVYEPVLSVEGPYEALGVYEPAIDGILRHYSSIATAAARCKKAAGDKVIIHFGIRAVHPIIAPMVDRAAYIGGCDHVSGVLGAKLIGEKPVGTMPHELIIVFGDQAEAWKAFDEVMPADVPRIMLCDTWFDERTEALKAAQTLGMKLYGVRIDTPKSRKGDIRKIVEEIRWTLNLHGYEHVKIVVSSGVDEYTISKLSDIVDIFGVGTAISFPKSIDLAFDIVEVNGKPIAKRGKMPGRKQVYRCLSCFHDVINPLNKEVSKCPICGGDVEPLLKPVILNGELVKKLPTAREIRNYVLKQLSKVELKL
jgi:nicotinate phosphoribosyltransferase